MTTVTNIKFSFKSKNEVYDIRKDFDIKCYTKNHNFIIRTNFCVFSFLGKNRRFVNVTGVQDVDQIKKATLFFSKITGIKVSQFFDFKIDCLAIKLFLEPGLKSKFLGGKSEIFKIVKTTRFPATILKANHDGLKTSLSYFNSHGVVIVNGLRRLSQLKSLILSLKKDFNF